MKSDCTTCYYFVSWRDDTFGLDKRELEGYCDFDTNCKGVNESDFCMDHETKSEHEIL